MSINTSEYILLRGKGSLVPTIENVGLGSRRENSLLAAVPDVLEIEAAELSLSERNHLRRDPGTYAIAPPMPMKLIEPTLVDQVDPSSLSASTWGIRPCSQPLML